MTENKKATEITVSAVLESITFDSSKFEVIRVFDVEEFNENTKERKNYANIREVISKRSVIKLWGHKDYVTVECSKMLRKKEQINADKKLYTSKTLDKNNNYICNTLKDATMLADDFLKQVDKMLSSAETSASQKKATSEKTA